MKLRIVKIKGKKEVIIKVNGIWVYKYHRCHCGCNERILWNKQHKYYGIPKFINRHNDFYNYSNRKGCRPNNYVDGYCHERGNSKGRGLGFEPINKKNVINNTMHHLDKIFVAFIPKELHNKYYHCGRHSDKVSRIVINEHVFDYLFDENILSKVEIEKIKDRLNY